MANPAARLATARPIRPRPITPRVRPWTSNPRKNSGPQIQGRRARRNRSPSVIRLAAASSSAQVRSAVASVTTSGVLVASTPLAVQAPRSRLSKPTAKLATTASSGPARSSSSPSTWSVSMASSPSLPATRSKSSARGMTPSPSQTSSRQPEASRARTGSGTPRVTSTAGMPGV